MRLDRLAASARDSVLSLFSRRRPRRARPARRTVLRVEALEARNAAGSLQSLTLPGSWTTDPTMSATASPSGYDPGTFALLGDYAPSQNPSSASLPAVTAQSTSPPSAAPPQAPAAPTSTTGSDAAFAGMQNNLFADPFGLTNPSPSAPLYPLPSTGQGAGAGSAAGASPSYSSPTPPGGMSMPPAPPPVPSPEPMPEYPPMSPLTWTNGGPTFHYAAAAAPYILAPGGQQNAEGDRVSVQVAATDPNVLAPPYNYTPGLTYDAVGLPSGLSINHANGLISGQINYGDAQAFGGAYDPKIVVADDMGASASQSFSWTVARTVRPATFAPINGQSNAIGDTVSLQVHATQPDGDQLIYDASNLPSGLTIDSLGGLISGTVANDAVSAAVTVTATDTQQTPAGQDVVASQTFNWNVRTVHAPQLTAPPSQTNAAGDVVSLPISATDAPGNTLTFSVTGLPDGLSIDPASGVISGTLPNDAASNITYSPTVSVSDGTATTSQTFSWAVNYVGVSNPGDQSNSVGDAVNLPISSVDALGLPVAYSVVGLPQGLSINPTTGVVSGTLAPVGETAQTSAVTVTATDGENSGSTTFQWDVSPQRLSDRTDAEGATVSIQTPVDYPNATPTFAATGLPSGVSISTTTGLISGTLPVGDAASGPYTVIVTTTYSSTDSTTQSFTWTVTPIVNIAPMLAAPGDQTSVAGTQVSVALAASDSDGDFLTYSATGLPDGLNLDEFSGIISGTPAEDAIQSAPYAVTVTVDAGSGATATQTFHWTVSDSTMAIQGDAITQVEGAGVNTFTVATFNDPDLNRQASDYSATINWGDGQTSQGSIDGANGAYTVSGDHVYLHPASLPLQVTVTDPVGGTATSVETAIVTAAPITATGGLQEGAMAGAASTFALATFTDANGYEAASSYTATIQWGDGSSATTGVVDGTEGVFRISGNHDYSADGTYTVTATLTDSDGTTATATSTVVVGDVIAGQTAEVTVASFTSSDPNATATSFPATIQWGDGTTSVGFVEGGNGVFSVLGYHAYAAPGAYNMQVTVTGGGGALSGATMVEAAPAAALGTGGSVTATVGQSMSMSAPLAVFAGSASQLSSATVAWGDGTASTAAVQQIAGSLVEVLASHVYATAGLFGVKTMVTNTAGALVGSAVSMIDAEPVAGPQIVGPAFVPGNSEYQYVVLLAAPVDARSVKAAFPAQNNGFSVSDGATLVSQTRLLHVKGPESLPEVAGFAVTVRFDNKPANVTLTLPNWRNGLRGAPLTFSVTVVQVTVTNPKNPFFVWSASKDTGQFPDSRTIDGAADQPIKIEHIVSRTSGPNAMNATARVVLTGPDGKGVDHILVGFLQTATPILKQSKFGNTILKSSMEGHTFLDSVASSDRPWYIASDPNALLKGDANNTDREIVFHDSPSANAVVVYDDGKKVATHVYWEMEYDLSVAAATTERGFDNSDALRFQEAHALWTFNADGSINSVQGGDNVKTPWTRDDNSGVHQPKEKLWDLNVPSPVSLLTTGDLANDAEKTQTYSTEAVKK